MASRNRFVRALASATSHVWFPATVLVARNVPRRLVRPLARRLGSAYFHVRQKYRQAVRGNLAVILGQPADADAVNRAADAMFGGLFAAWFDFLHFASRPPEESARLIEGVVGFSRIVEARQKGKGVLLLTAHLGNWEVGGFMLAQVKMPIHVVLVPDIFPGVERARRRLHQEAGIVEIPVDRTFVPTLSVMRALEDNGVVAMQGDRDFDNTGVAVPFFGKESFFPRGPFRVAMATGAAVLPAFIIQMPDGRYRAVVEEPLTVESGGDRETALRVNLERYVAILERYVREFPEQWYCFYPFWDDPSRRSAAQASGA
jgi:Kdo2-lipid IVA lauroyltransferase/acyltransferase